MKAQESYWSFKSDDIPELNDLPPGTFAGDERDWNSLSPGYRREIWRQAVKRLNPEEQLKAAPQFKSDTDVRRGINDQKNEAHFAAKQRL